ncbi:MAG: hypothetical protein R2798_04065 [Chitinophagales bacterium]
MGWQEADSLGRSEVEFALAWNGTNFGNMGTSLILGKKLFVNTFQIVAYHNIG